MQENLIRFAVDKTFVVIDFETENLMLSYCQNRPWQIAMVKAQNGKEIDVYENYIKWEKPISVGKEAARITRFDKNKYSALAVDQNACFNIMYEWLTGADYIIAHNGLGFDLYLLKEWCLMHNKPWKQFVVKLIDTNLIAKGIKLNIPFKSGESFLEYQYKLYHKIQKGIKTNIKVCCKDYALTYDENLAHEALYDVRKNLEIWEKMKWHVEF